MIRFGTQPCAIMGDEAFKAQIPNISRQGCIAAPVRALFAFDLTLLFLSTWFSLC
jgi:hypothetical protein